MKESLIKIEESPQVGQTWETDDGKLLTIIKEGILDAVMPYFKYIDIEGKVYYSRKEIFHIIFKRKVENVHRTESTKND